MSRNTLEYASLHRNLELSLVLKLTLHKPAHAHTAPLTSSLNYVEIVPNLTRVVSSEKQDRVVRTPTIQYRSWNHSK